MLHSPLPKARYRFISLPLLGTITDGFDDWLAASGFTQGSRKFSIRMLPLVDANLRRRRVDSFAKLSHPVLQDCWKALMKVYYVRMLKNDVAARVFEPYHLGNRTSKNESKVLCLSLSNSDRWRRNRVKLYVGFPKIGFRHPSQRFESNRATAITFHQRSTWVQMVRKLSTDPTTQHLLESPKE